MTVFLSDASVLSSKLNVIFFKLMGDNCQEVVFQQ